MYVLTNFSFNHQFSLPTVTYHSNAYFSSHRHKNKYNQINDRTNNNILDIDLRISNRFVQFL